MEGDARAFRLAAVLGASLARRLVGEAPLIALTVAAAAAYAAYGLLEHARLETGYDLAIFDQAVWHYSRLETPVSTLTGQPHILGDHFHPILVLLAPLYWLWSNPQTLLGAQAVLVAASIVPVVLFARPRLGRHGALLLGISYATFWGVQSAIGFEFHEVAFAPLLIALAVLFIDRRSWIGYAVAIAALLLVKEDMAILVCFFGVYLATLREYRWAAITFVAGLVWYELATQVFIPHFSADGEFRHWTYTRLGSDLPDAVWSSLTHPWRPFEVFVEPARKLGTTALLLAPFLGLPLLSRVSILAIPLVAERMLSTTSAYWETAFHYSLTVAPVLAMGAAAGLATVARLPAVRARPEVMIAVPAAMVVAGLAVAGAVLQPTPLFRLAQPDLYRHPPYVAAGVAAAARVPVEAPVTTQDFLAPRLSRRDGLYAIHPTLPIRGWVVANVLEPVGSTHWGPTFRAQQRRLISQLGGYVPVFLDAGTVVWRPARPGRPELGTVGGLPRAPARRLVAADLAWQGALVRYGGALVGCSSAPDRRACYRPAEASFRRRQRELDALLAGVVPSLHGGCRDLAGAARAGAAATAAGLERVRRSFLRDDAQARRDALAPLAHAIDDLDLPGRLDFLVVVCARAASEPPPRAG